MRIEIPPRHGSRHGSSKLNEEFVIELRRSAHQMGYYPVSRIARANHVTYRALKDALTGKTYKHVDKIAAPFLGPTGRAPNGCVVRIDTGSTHGWQARLRGKSKFFSDRKFGAHAPREAKIWLQLQRSILPGRGEPKT